MLTIDTTASTAINVFLRNPMRPSDDYEPNAGRAYCLGSCNPRVAMMLRWISDVPAAMVLGTDDM